MPPTSGTITITSHF